MLTRPGEGGIEAEVGGVHLGGFLNTALLEQ
jgi:hypothetical protein